MPKKSNKKSLTVASPEICFWVNHGPILKDLKDLCCALKNIDKSTFKHHVNKEKNDFAKWVNDALKDEQLAIKLAKCKTPSSMFKVIDVCLKSDYDLDSNF